MEHGRIAIVEDDEKFATQVADYIERFSTHQVVVVSHSLPDVLGLIDRMAEGQIDIDAMTLDGNLRRGHYDCADARRIVDTMRLRGLTTKIIGYSGQHLADFGIPVDVDLTKNGSLFRLTKTLDSI